MTTTIPTTARPTPQDGQAPAAASPHAAAGAPPTHQPDCSWCGDTGLVLVADVRAGRAHWYGDLTVPCVCAPRRQVPTRAGRVYWPAGQDGPR